MMKLSKSEIANFFIVFLFLSYKYFLMWFSNFGIKINYLIIIPLALSIIVLVNKKYTKSILIKIFILLLFFAFSYYNSQSIDILLAIIFSLLFYDREKGDREFIKYFVIVSSILFSLTIILSLLGIINSTTSQRVVNGAIILRKSLGFSHANSAFIYFMPIVLGIMYTKGEKLNKPLFIFVIDVISIILYAVTLSRTGLLLIIILNFLLFFDFIIIRSKIFKMIAKYNYIILLLVSIYLGIKIGVIFENPINELLSYRPFYYNQAISFYGFHIFGSTPNGNIILDNSYLTYLLIYGIIPYIFYTFFQIKTFDFFKNDRKKIIILFIFALYGVLENNFIYSCNFILALQFIFFLSQKKEQIVTGKDGSKNVEES